MPAPKTAPEFLALLNRSGLIEPPKVDEFVRAHDGLATQTAAQAAAEFVEAGLLTRFQTEQLLKGKFRGFNIGKYRVLDRIGAGGMGQVFLAEHPQLGRRAAIKVLPTDRASDPALLARFLREAQAAASLDHPNIVRAFDVDEDNGLHFLVMEYVDGEDLYHMIKKGGPLPVSKACDFIRQAAEGLQHAHEAGLIHRDVKPSNILVDKAGVAKLLDLGLARFTEEGGDHITRRYDGNNVLGTADYVAPEQTRDSHEVDQRCDVYALGGTLYFLLTGHAPFPNGSPAEKMIAHRSQQPKSVREIRPEVPPGMALVIDKMLEKNPDQRYQSARAAADALEPWAPKAPQRSSAFIHLPPAPSFVEVALPPHSAQPSRWRLGWPAVAALVMLGCGFGALAGRWLQSPAAVAQSADHK